MWAKRSFSIFVFQKIHTVHIKLTRMHSSRMRTARSLIVSLYLVISHACLPFTTHIPFTTHTPLHHAPSLQPCMAPSNHACPQEPCMPPRTMHAPSNHAHPPSPHMSPSNHACPPANTHALITMHAPPSNHARPPPCGQNSWHASENIALPQLRCGRVTI